MNNIDLAAVVYPFHLELPCCLLSFIPPLRFFHLFQGVYTLIFPLISCSPVCSALNSDILAHCGVIQICCFHFPFTAHYRLSIAYTHLCQFLPDLAIYGGSFVIFPLFPLPQQNRPHTALPSSIARSWCTTQSKTGKFSKLVLAVAQPEFHIAVLFGA